MVASLGVPALAACVLVPVDPRTGAPANWPQQAAVTVVTPPAAPPQQQAGSAVYTARLYPLNDAANRVGMLTAVVIDGGSGRGTFTFNYAGDAMQGEATRVDGAGSAFGRIHMNVLGSNPGSAPGKRGIANAYGAKGVSAQCEYLIQAPNLGTGACLFSDGAKYQMHFGS
jgi:hypothetical protein